MNKKNIYIGWDIGGAHTKYTVTNDNSSSLISKIIPLRIWESLDPLKKLLNNIVNEYGEDYLIINVISMSGEMCDIFSTRKEGVERILSLFNKRLFKNYIYTLKFGIILLNKNINYKHVASTNWHIIASYLSLLKKNVIAIDLGSTTTDIILIKNNKCINKRIDDFTGLSQLELLYTGVLRTPIFAITKEIKLNGKIYRLIPEYYATMADIYRLLGIISSKDDYSDTADDRTKSKRNTLARVSRSIGLDYQAKNENLIISICVKIMSEHLDQISYTIDGHIKKNFKHFRHLELIGMGIGKNIIKEICIKNKWFYTDLEDIIDIPYMSNLSNASITAPSFLLSLLMKRTYEKTK